MEVIVASFSVMVELVREVFPLGLVRQPFHIFVVIVMVVVVVSVVMGPIGVRVVAVHSVRVVHWSWVVHLVVRCGVGHGMVCELVTVVWIFCKRVNVAKVSIFHGVFLSLSLSLHFAPIFLTLLLFHASLLLLLATELLAHLFVLLLLGKVFISMVHSVVVVHWNMVAFVPVSHWSSIMVEFVGIVSHCS